MRINRNLFTLKCVMFSFFAGVGCLYPFLPLHMLAVGLTRNEARIVSIVAPFVAMLGPAIAGPLADKLSVGRGNAGDKNGGSGRILRLMIAACFLLGALFYLLLLAVPVSERHQVHRPNVSFMCHPRGAVVFQQVCSEDRTCNRWKGIKSGALVVDQCDYVCDDSPESLAAMAATEGPAETTDFPLSSPVTSATSSAAPPEESDYNAYGGGAAEDGWSDDDERRPPAPHLCRNPGGAPGDGVCQVYTSAAEQLRVQLGLRPGADNLTDDQQWCAFHAADRFHCVIPEEKIAQLRRQNGACSPVVRCRVLDPYDVEGGVLAQAPCQLVVGDPAATFWLYLFIRSIADIFPTAALGLLGAACVVATRETSRGRGDVGRQFAVASLALLVFPPLAGWAARDLAGATPHFLVPILMFAAFMWMGAAILIVDRDMPLSPPEWWWHTANGTLAMPLNTVRRYGAEIAGLFAVLVLLGVLWSGLDTYLPWTLQDLSADYLSVGLTVCVGALLAAPALWWAETVVDYVGHSNLLITAFLFYAVRFTGMGFINEHAWALPFELLEVFTLSLVWVTAILYFRHLVPRKYTSSGQALPVLAHFGIGRLVGAVLGGLVVSPAALVSTRDLYSALALLALCVAALYLALYHLLLAPSCAAQPVPPDQALLEASTVEAQMKGLNTNGTRNGGGGTCSPVRVYHEERGRKAQFRY